MKKVFIAMLLLFATVASAQYHQRTDADRAMRNRSNPTAVKKGEKPDLVELSLKKLRDELALDSFQEAVARQLLTDSQKEEERVFSEDIPDQSKIEKIIAIREKLSTKIKETLTPEQLEKYERLGKKKKK